MLTCVNKEVKNALSKQPASYVSRAAVRGLAKSSLPEMTEYWDEDGVMGEVVKLNDYRKQQQPQPEELVRDSLVPIEFAVGCGDRTECLSKIAQYGVRAIHIRMVNEEPDALVYLMGVRDAIWLNKKILEREELSDDEIAARIDVIQMLENANLALMENLWKSFTRRSGFSSNSSQNLP
jgi:hypothetical protein